jgi:hypothetical protein
MDVLSDAITYVRRIVKTPSNASLTDSLIIDYINRFWLMDIQARAQFFDFKTKWSFQTMQLVSDYNIPMYSIQTEPGSQQISYYPVYQGFTGTSYVNGIQIPMYIQRDSFWKIWPNYIQSLPNAAFGDGSTTTFQMSAPFFPAVPGHLDMTGVIAAANGGTLSDPIFSTTIPANIPYSSFNPGVYITYQNANGGTTTIADSGIFLSTATGGALYGLLIEYQNPGGFNPSPFGYSALTGGYTTTSNTVNYATGVINVTFPTAPLANQPIQIQSYYYQQGIPRAILQYNNVLTIRPPPNIPYLIELDAYLTPAAFLSTSQAIQFGYMTEYIGRGAARKILSDTGDWEQFNAYEPLFLEQERNVWKRSQRIFTSQRTGTIYSDLQGPQSNLSGIGQGAT